MKIYQVEEYIIKENHQEQLNLTGTYSSYWEALKAIRGYLLECFSDEEMALVMSSDPYDPDSEYWSIYIAETNDYYAARYDIFVKDLDAPLE